MKRFWTEATAAAEDGGHGVRLDGRPVRTPARALLLLPNAALAEAVAAEWRAVEGEVNPQHMPLTGIANAAIDLVSPDPAAFAARLAAYAETDLLCYRAEHPQPLADRQALIWEPPLTAVEQSLGCAFHRTAGIGHVAQPGETLERVRARFAGYGPHWLAALDPIVTITGSAVLALALAEGLAKADDVFDASVLDELWQEEQWGADAEALETRKGRRALFDAAVQFLRLA